VRAKADTIRLAATQLLAIGAQRRGWERRMGQLLLGAPRSGRAKQPGEKQPGRSVPGGKVYLSFPGLGDRLAARVAGEIGDHPQQFSSPNALQCYAGKAPVTRRSGKRELVVSTRQACNRHLADAVQQWAFCSLSRSGWAREFYDQQRRRGKGHHAALRALGNRWLEILWHCLIRGQLYDEATHIATATVPWARPPDPKVAKECLTLASLMLLPSSGCLAGRSALPLERGNGGRLACRRAAGGKLRSQRSRPDSIRLPAIGRLGCRVGWWGACGWGSGMPAPTGQIPPPWAWWENEAPTTRAARRPVPGRS
jgi:hypothetical protein